MRTCWSELFPMDVFIAAARSCVSFTVLHVLGSELGEERRELEIEFGIKRVGIEGEEDSRVLACLYLVH